MKKRNLAPEKKTERVKRERDPIPWRYCLLTLVCGLLLVVGFFWAARQHFSAMDLGIKNAKLRQQKESLEAEARRLYLTKEISLSPAEIKKAAKKLGLQELTAESIQVISPTPKTEPTLPEKPKQASVVKGKDENLKKTDKPNSEEKTAGKTKDGKDKSARPQIAKKTTEN